MTNEDDLVEAWRALADGCRRRPDPAAEDHVQDAVVAALDERRRTGRTPVAARAWLRTVARRREVDDIRRAQCERRVVAESAAVAAPAEDGVGDLLDRYEARWLAAEVERLPAATRLVVHELATGGTQAEVAGRLGMTPRAVEAHVRRARLALRRVLERAGVLVGLVVAGRWWRRTTAATAVGVAAAVVGVSMVGTPDSHRLLPVPRPEQAIESDPPARKPARVVAAAPRADAVRPAPPAAADVRATARRGDVAPPPPTPVPPPSPDDDEPPPDEPPVTQLTLVPSHGKAEGAVPTQAGAWYEVTVAGTYSYNGHTGLADCGHLLAEGATEWTVYESLLVDRVAAPCAKMPVDDAHVYRWRLRGTGRPVTFRVQDHGGGGDNLGQLVVNVTRVPD